MCILKSNRRKQIIMKPKNKHGPSLQTNNFIEKINGSKKALGIQPILPTLKVLPNSFQAWIQNTPQNSPDRLHINHSHHFKNNKTFKN